MGSIFDQIGGEDAVGAAVDIFYDKVLDDPTLARYLDGVDMQRLREHQREFMTAALGGPDEYLGRSMRAAHSGLGITDAAFDAVIGHFTATLRELGVSQATFGEVVDTLSPLRDEIVTGGR